MRLLRHLEDLDRVGEHRLDLLREGDDDVLGLAVVDDVDRERVHRVGVVVGLVGRGDFGCHFVLLFALNMLSYISTVTVSRGVVNTIRKSLS